MSQEYACTERQFSLAAPLADGELISGAPCLPPMPWAYDTSVVAKLLDVPFSYWPTKVITRGVQRVEVAAVLKDCNRPAGHHLDEQFWSGRDKLRCVTTALGLQLPW